MIDYLECAEKYLLSVVIINYKTPDLIINCLISLLPELEGIHASIQIIDNHSKDDSVKKIEHWLNENTTRHEINLIQSPNNLGFSGGNNLGIKAACANYYLLLNSDTQVREGSVSRLIAEAEKHQQAGLISPRLEWPDGTPQKSCFRYQTPFSEFISSAGTGPITKLLSRYQVALPVSDVILHPEWTSFACVLVRKEVFQNIGLMDDDFFMYFEDSDFCYRAFKAGWDIVHTPIARVVHLRGGSSPVKEKTRLRKRLPRYFYESRTRYYYKQYGRIGLTAANLLWWAGRIISRLRELVGNKQPHVCEHEWVDIWINWWKPLKPYNRT